MKKRIEESQIVSQSVDSKEVTYENGDVEGELLKRGKGWVYRGDRVTERQRQKRHRKPQKSRYTKIQKMLESHLFNSGWVYVDTKKVEKEGHSFNCIDLFSGCGGISLGFEQANFRSLFAVEVDPDAAATYKMNFPHARVWDAQIETLTDEQAREIIGEQPVHVLIAGFPCQGFSIAGQRNPKDERNVLFRQVIRMASVLRPWFIVLENVPGIITISHGIVFQTIREEFAEIGYPNMSTLVLESADFGVPQYRPRAIFVANRFGLPNPYPKPTLKSQNHATIESAIDDIKHLPRNSLPNHDWTYHSPEMEKRIAEVEPGGSLYDSYTDAWKRQYKGYPAMTIKENHGGTHIHYELNRTISAREMARLQSFPDEFLFHGSMKRSMFQIGNAIPPLLGYHIALALRHTLTELDRNQKSH